MKYISVGLLALLWLGATSIAQEAAMPRYEHVFVIIAENKSFEQIIGSARAPRMTALAKEYGLATRFYGEVHPSEANYIAMLGGNTFGIHDDDAWYCEPGRGAPHCRGAMDATYAMHSIKARSLMDQLDDAHMTWRGYFEDLPAPGSMVIYDPSPEHPDPIRPHELYAAKHNGFISFERVRHDPDIATKIVPLSRLQKDLDAETLPNYAHVVLNQCNEMHGLFDRGGPPPPEGCVIDFKRPETIDALIQRGDTHIGALVDAIMASPAWSKPENFAIVITWDEDDRHSGGDQGCCGFETGSVANFGGGHIPTIVITNHGPRHMEDPTPYNHYSLLRTTEDAFGLSEHLGFAGATDKGVKSMTPLFELKPRSANATEGQAQR